MRPHGRIERLGGIGETPARAWRRRTLRGAASSVGRIALLFSLPASLPRLVRRSPGRIRGFRQSLLSRRAGFACLVAQAFRHRGGGGGDLVEVLGVFLVTADVAAEGAVDELEGELLRRAFGQPDDEGGGEEP